jgi:hypothetical protein
VAAVEIRKTVVAVAAVETVTERDSCAAALTPLAVETRNYAMQ